MWSIKFFNQTMQSFYKVIANAVHDVTLNEVVIH